MNLQELIRTEIENEKNNNKTREELIGFLESLAKKYIPSGHDSFRNFSIGELLAISYSINCPDVSKAELEYIIEQANDYFKTILGEDIYTLNNVVHKYLDNYNSSNVLTILGQAINKSKNFTNFLDELMKKNPKILNDWITLIKAKMGQIYIIKTIGNMNEIEKKDLNEAVKKSTNELRKLVNYGEVLIRFKKLIEDKKHTFYNSKKRINLYEELLKKFKEGKPFKTVDKTWKDFPNNIYIELIKLVLKQQDTEYQLLSEREKQLSSIFMLLSNYGIDGNMIQQIEQIEDIKLYEGKIKETLALLSSNNFPISSIKNKDCLLGLLKAKDESIKILLSCYKTGAISIPFIEEHYQIILNDERFVQNFDMLRSEAAKFNCQQYDSNILLIKPIELEKRINLARIYGLSLNSNKYVFNLIKDARMFDLLDFAIEHQLPLDEIIKSDGDFIELEKRIIVAENFGVETLTESNEIPYNIMNGNSFFLTGVDLGELIEDSTPWYQNLAFRRCLDSTPRLEIDSPDSIIQDLDKEHLDDTGKLYYFNGVFISRNKVLRNRTAIKRALSDPIIKKELALPDEVDEKEILFQSIIYQTALRTDELEAIRKCIFPSKEKKYNE